MKVIQWLSKEELHEIACFDLSFILNLFPFFHRFQHGDNWRERSVTSFQAIYGFHPVQRGTHVWRSSDPPAVGANSSPLPPRVSTCAFWLHVLLKLARRAAHLSQERIWSTISFYDNWPSGKFIYPFLPTSTFSTLEFSFLGRSGLPFPGKPLDQFKPSRNAVTVLKQQYYWPW